MVNFAEENNGIEFVRGILNDGDTEHIDFLAQELLSDLKKPLSGKEIQSRYDLGADETSYALKQLRDEGKIQVVGSVSERIVPRIEGNFVWQWTPEYAKTQTFTAKFASWMSDICSLPYKK